MQGAGVVDLQQLTREQLLELVGEQRAVIEAQQAQIAELTALMLSQAQRIQVQDAKLDEQAVRIAELERQLGRNSSNSSQPPSKDQFRGENRRARRAAGRSPGKQPGAEGNHLARVVAPDVVIDHDPVSCCGCGTGFDAGAAAGCAVGVVDDLGFVARQVHDLPASVAVVVTEHRLHRRRCGCGVVSTAPAPSGVNAPTQYGPVVTAWVGYLLVAQHLPYERAVGLIADLCPGLVPSTGWARNALHRLAQASGPVLEVVRDRLRDPGVTPVLHADETTLSIAGKKWWLHVASSATLTSFHLDPSRGRSAVAAHAVLPGYAGTVVHDALSVYDAYPDARHVLCGAHLLRELTAAGEAHPGQVWPGAAIDALTGLLAATHAARAAGHAGPDGLDAHDKLMADGLRRDVRHAVLCGLAAHPATGATKQSKTRNLLRRMQEREQAYLTFAEDLGVPFTNNQAERDLRPAKTQMKISGCHRSPATAGAWTSVRSLVSTWRKNTRHVLTELQALLAGNPWLPAT